VATGQFDSDNFTVPDLRVGEIRALRTFRLSENGRLCSLVHYASGEWDDGASTARCLAHGHTPAAPGCGCGFYAYGTYDAVRDHDEAHDVVAVVACWGRVVPGTRGLRAQHARIEAIWLSATVPRHLVWLLHERYPSVAFYRSRRLMLARHRPTRLDSYQREPWRLRRRLQPLRRGPSSFDKFMTNLLDSVISVSLVLAIVFNLFALIVLVLDTFWPGPFREWPLLSNLHRK
jgi:hypothetical protein